MELCNGPHGGRAPPTVLLRLVLNLPGAIAAFDDCPLVQVFQGRKLVFDTEHDEDAHVSRRRLPFMVRRTTCIAYEFCPLCVCVCAWVSRCQAAWDGSGCLPLQVNVCVSGDIQIRVLIQDGDKKLQRLVARCVGFLTPHGCLVHRCTGGDRIWMLCAFSLLPGTISTPPQPAARAGSCCDHSPSTFRPAMCWTPRGLSCTSLFATPAK